MARMFSTIALISGILVASVAHAGKAKELTDLKDLKDDEGVLLLVLHSPNERDTKFYFKGPGGGFKTPGFPSGTSFRLLRVKAGEYDLTAWYVGAIKLLAEDFMHITVEPGTITYPGDLAMDGRTMRIYERVDQRMDDLMEMNQAFAEWPVIVGASVQKNRRRVYEGTKRF